VKKAISIFIAILVGLYALLSFLDFHGEYPAEKELWRINLEFAQAGKDPQIIPAAKFDKIRHRYEKLIERFPESRLVALAHVLIGRVYLTQKDYPKAREKYEDVIGQYRISQPNVAVKAAEDIGKSYAAENDSANVLKNYKRIRKEFPLSDTGLKVPVFIGQFYLARNEQGLAIKAFSDAIRYYRTMIAQYPDTATAFNAWRLIATCYFKQNEKEKGVKVLGEVLNNFSTSKYMSAGQADTIVKLINTTSVIYLKDYSYPIRIYEKFIRDHPGHPFNKTFEAMVDSFNLLEENVTEIGI